MDESKKILFKTLDEGCSPQGMTKIYFTSHPDDFDQYFEQISKDILRQHDDCCICYKRNPKEKLSSDDMKDLDDMRLFVIPITSKFLLDKDNVGLVEFKYAYNHIQILPILMEEKIDSEFNEICGHIQFITKAEFEDHSLEDNHDNKFHRSLKYILSGKEFKLRVRDEFAAQIFVSYRKSDRKHVRRLMEQIHDQDFCRDVAIWFDDYLEPSENFDDAIYEAIWNSKIFAMAITSRMLEKGNYVLESEYPSAIKKENETGIEMLFFPALMESMTSDEEKEFKEVYKRISRFIDAKDEQDFDKKAFSRALWKQIQKLDLEKKDGPEHLFLIGMAYLNGIDTLRDPKLGVQMIRHAAEEGYPEAMDRLWRIYSMGDGVNQNDTEANQWLSRLAELHKEKFEAGHLAKDGDDLVDDLFILANSYYKANLFDMAKQTYEALRTVTGEMMDLFGGDEKLFIKNQRIFALCDEYIGIIYADEKNFSEAKELFEKFNKEILKANERANGRYFREVAHSYERLGDVNRQLRDLSKARRCYEKLYELYEKNFKDPLTKEQMDDKASCYERLGLICKDDGDLSDAEQWFLSAFELRDKLFEKKPTVEAGYGLSNCYTYLGDVCVANNDLKTAEKFFYDDLELSKSIYSTYDKHTIRARKNLSVSLERMGDIKRLNGDFAKAEEMYHTSLKYREELKEKTHSKESYRDLAISYDKLGDLCMLENNYDEAENLFTQSYEIRKELCEDGRTPEQLSDLANSYDRLGNVAMKKGLYSVARDHYENGKKFNLELDGLSKTLVNQRRLYASFYNLGQISLAEGDDDQAINQFNSGLEIAERWNQISEEFSQVERKIEAGIFLVEAELGFGTICIEKHYFEYALKLCTAGRDKCLQLSGRSHKAEVGTLLVQSYKLIGDIHINEKEWEDAVENLNKAVELIKKQKNRTTEDYRELFYLYKKLSYVGSEMGDLDKYKTWLEKSLEIFNEWNHRCMDKSLERPSIDVRVKVLQTYISLIELCQNNEYKEKPGKWYAKAVNLYKELEKEEQTVELRRDLSNACIFLGSFCLEENRLKQSRDWFYKGWDLTEELGRETEDEQDYKKIYDFVFRISAVDSQNPDISVWNRAQSTFEKLVETYPTVRSYAEILENINYEIRKHKVEEIKHINVAEERRKLTELYGKGEISDKELNERLAELFKLPEDN